MRHVPVNVYIFETRLYWASVLEARFSEQIQILSFFHPARLLEVFQTTPSATAEIVVLDVGLSDEDIELVHQIKHRAPNTEVVVLTNSKSHEAVLRTLREEVHHIFEKPIAESDFCAFLDSIIQRIVIVGSRNFSNYDSRRNESEAGFFNLKAFYKSLVDELSESAPHALAGDIAEIRHHFYVRSMAVQYSVLVVDDEIDIRSGVRLNLQNQYDVLEAENGEVALQKLLAFPNIEVVLLDVRMPGEWGNVLLPKIKAIRPDVEVVILTAYQETGIVIDTFQKGTYEYLNKPFTKLQLQQAVYHALNVKLTRQFGNRLPVSDRMVFFEEYSEIKKCMKQPITYEELGLFFRETLLLEIPLKQPVECHGQSIISFVQALVHRAESFTSDELNRVRNMAVEQTLVFTRNPTDENRVKMQEILNRLGQFLS